MADAPSADAVLVLFEVDPATNEALGAVHPFCSEKCRDACLGFDPAPDHLGAVYAKGTTDEADFACQMKCESCGEWIPTQTGVTDG